MKDKINSAIKKIKDNGKKYFSFLDKNKKFNLMEVIALMIITIIFGMFFGGLLMYRKGTINYGIRKELREFADTYTEILNEFYTNVDKKGLLEAGINGMVNYLGDPYSVYMDSEEATAFNEKVSGEYVGIGIEIIQYTDMKVEILESYETGPAYKAGLRAGDVIIKIDDEDVRETSINEISQLVKGKAGTSIKVTVLRGDAELEFNVKRDSIDIKSVKSEIIEYNDEEIGYIAIDLFAANTFEQFKENLENIEKEGIDSLIIDVRGNSGGYLTTVSNILELFLQKGKMIYQLKTKEKIEKFYDKTDESRDYKVAVLVNGASASASELLTACMKDTYGAYTIGTTTYGKSKVQKTQELSNGSSIKYTFQEWLTPEGISVGDKGIEPEYVIKYEASDIDHEYDSQLQKALDLLAGIEE
ncbi:MAG: S41 family peptidase [Bacilli bacterium]|nr:S41 family peptidase [Bacilli bacterium]